MPGRPDCQERRRRLAPLEPLHGVHTSSCSPERRLVGLVHHGSVRIEVAAAREAPLLDPRHVARVVHPAELLARGATGRELDDRLPEPGLFQAAAHGVEALGRLGVARPGLVRLARPVVAEQDRHRETTVAALQ